MKKYIQDYIKDLEIKLDKNHRFTIKEKMLLKDKILYFQHERLIHLLVTLFYALFTLCFIFLSIIFPGFLVPCFIVIIILIFYVLHYFFLENAVQYLYKLYDRIM